MGLVCFTRFLQPLLQLPLRYAHSQSNWNIHIQVNKASMCINNYSTAQAVANKV